MRQLIRSLVLAMMVLVSVNTGTATSEAGSSKPDAVSIRVCDAHSNVNRALGPQVIVLVVNNSDKPIAIDRHLRGVPIARSNSLRVSINDAKTGKETGLRAKFKPIERRWRESDLVTLDPNTSYGPILDLRDFFFLKHGGTYRVTFEYVSLPPKKVGATVPWHGLVTKQTAVVTVP